MYAAVFPEVGIGLLRVAFAFGLTVLTMAYAVGGISGGHFNPAVTLCLVAAGRHSAGDAVRYIIAQVLGATAAVVLLHVIASLTAGFDVATATYAANGFGEGSPGSYNMSVACLMEALMTFFFLIIINGSTHSKVPVGFDEASFGLGRTPRVRGEERRWVHSPAAQHHLKGSALALELHYTRPLPVKDMSAAPSKIPVLIGAGRQG